MPTNVLNPSSFDRMAESIHLSRCGFARHGCLYVQNSWNDSFKYQALTSGEFHRTSVESRSFWPLFRFQGFFSSSQRVPLKFRSAFYDWPNPSQTASACHKSALS
jgi:hypothetical protein